MVKASGNLGGTQANGGNQPENSGDDGQNIHGIGTFGTLKFFRNGTAHQYFLVFGKERMANNQGKQSVKGPCGKAPLVKGKLQRQDFRGGIGGYGWVLLHKNGFLNGP